MLIFILEDDISLAEGVKISLKEDGRDFIIANSVSEGNRLLEGKVPSLFIVDVNLPDGNGIDFCKSIRNHGYDAPVLFLTANDTEMDEIIGFESGGDDYMTKPFSIAILRARVAALLKRNNQSATNDETGICYDDYYFDFAAFIFKKGNQLIDLSKTEAKLLKILFMNKGQTITREILLERVWPDGSEFVDENTLSVAIRRLRKKLENNPSEPKYIKTIHGLGYKWESKNGI